MSNLPQRGRSQRPGKQEWPFSSSVYMPDLDFGYDIHSALGYFERSQLSETTEVTVLRCAKRWSEYQEILFNEHCLLIETEPKPAFELFSINRYICRDPDAHQPDDARQLRISRTAFRALMSRYDVPTAFIAAICRVYQTCGSGFREHSGSSKSGSVWEHWCVLPVRVEISCRDNADIHAKSTAGRNQMDPFHYIHLPDAHFDIRGSHVGLFVRHDRSTGTTTVICFNFLDGRWPYLVDEPLNRIREAINHRGRRGAALEPSFIHLIFLSSIVRWWNNVHLTINQQLIAHEQNLQAEMEDTKFTSSALNTNMNKSLHIMAAHVHRYRSELSRLEDVMTELSLCYEKSFSLVDTTDNDDQKADRTSDSTRVRLGYQQLISQLRAVRSFHEELERKIQNILALLFNNIQVTNDRIMQALLQAAQTEAQSSQEVAKQSYELTQSMGEDSIAMKTIAIVTMVFLPGTSYAALLAMPFFANLSYLHPASHFWVWVVLTVPSTVISFTIYAVVMRRRRRARSRRLAYLERKSGSGGRGGAEPAGSAMQDLRASDA